MAVFGPEPHAERGSDMSFGYNGKILHIDLSRREISVEEPSESLYRSYLGGPGIGMYYLLKLLKPGVDPLSPENVLVFAPGAITGSPGPGVVRLTVCAKSPLTNTAGKSEAGGFWGPELKNAGLDAVVVRGKASSPVYIWIDGDGVEIRDARHLWGKTTGEAQAAIRQELGSDKVRVAQIGPGGENLVRFANITNDLAHFNGRNGLGAVMGSKNLKAIAVRAGGKLPLHDSGKVAEITRWVAQEMKNHPLAWGLHDQGTPAGVVTVNAGGALPTNNWSSGTFPRAEDIGEGKLTSTILVDRKGCYSCPIRCKRVVRVDREGLQVDPQYGGPEYETLVALGSNCGIGNLELLAKANELCNAYTLDTISTGMTISFAMDAYEHDLITPEDTGGLELRFGNEEALLPLIEMIALRKGFGNILADGSVRAARVIGKGSDRFLLHSKGQEVPMHDPRVKTGLGLQYALSGYGADHWVAQHDPLYQAAGSPGLKGLNPMGILEPIAATDLTYKKVRAFYYTSLLTMAYDCLGVCVFAAVSRSILPLDKLVDLVNAVTGWDTGLWELLKGGERVINMYRAFNAREGFTPADDAIPEKFFTPLQGGSLDGKGALDRGQFQEALGLFYRMAGWDPESGKPLSWKLEELDLAWVEEVMA